MIGIDHERFGEAPRAYVVKNPDSPITEAEIEKYVAENTASYKHLVGGVEFIGEVPKSNSGKILRKELKAAFIAGKSAWKNKIRTDWRQLIFPWKLGSTSRLFLQ